MSAWASHAVLLLRAPCVLVCYVCCSAAAAAGMQAGTRTSSAARGVLRLRPSVSANDG